MRSRHSIRLKEYDYSSPGDYFVTIITKFRESFFGLPDTKDERLSLFNEIVASKWTEIFDPDSENLGSVVMPNHFHGVIRIRQHDFTSVTDHEDVLQRRRMKLSKMIGKFKMTSSKAINDLLEEKEGARYFKWQPNYYERIIRNSRELSRVLNYIEANPVKWKHDVLNTPDFSGDRMDEFLGGFSNDNP